MSVGMCRYSVKVGTYLEDNDHGDKGTLFRCGHHGSIMNVVTKGHTVEVGDRGVQ